MITKDAAHLTCLFLIIGMPINFSPTNNSLETFANSRQIGLQILSVEMRQVCKCLQAFANVYKWRLRNIFW